MHPHISCAKVPHHLPSNFPLPPAADQRDQENIRYLDFVTMFMPVMGAVSPFPLLAFSCFDRIFSVLIQRKNGNGYFRIGEVPETMDIPLNKRCSVFLQKNLGDLSSA